MFIIRDLAIALRDPQLMRHGADTRSCGDSACVEVGTAPIPWGMLTSGHVGTHRSIASRRVHSRPNLDTDKFHARRPSHRVSEERACVKSRRVPWQRVGWVRWSAVSGILIVVVEGPLDPAHARQVCAALRAELSESDVSAVACRGMGLIDPNLATVDMLARLRLATHRIGCAMRVDDPSPRLQELLLLAGLDTILAPFESGAEARW